MPTPTCSTSTSDAGVCIYPYPSTSRACMICGRRKPFDPADWFEPWPSWAGLKPGDTILVDHAAPWLTWGELKAGDPVAVGPWPAVVVATHRSGAQVKVTPPGGVRMDPWIQFVTQQCGDDHGVISPYAEAVARAIVGSDAPS